MSSIFKSAFIDHQNIRYIIIKFLKCDITETSTKEPVNHRYHIGALASTILEWTSGMIVHTSVLKYMN